MTVRATRRIIAYVESKQYKFCSKRNARCHEGTRNHSKICSNTFRTINFRRASERKEEKKKWNVRVCIGRNVVDRRYLFEYLLFILKPWRKENTEIVYFERQTP